MEEKWEISIGRNREGKISNISYKYRWEWKVYGGSKIMYPKLESAFYLWRGYKGSNL